jgi:hypothetical protein
MELTRASLTCGVRVKYWNALKQTCHTRRNGLYALNRGVGRMEIFRTERSALRANLGATTGCKGRRRHRPWIPRSEVWKN